MQEGRGECHVGNDLYSRNGRLQRRIVLLECREASEAFIALGRGTAMQIGVRCLAMGVVGFFGLAAAFADHAPESQSTAPESKSVEPAAAPSAPAPMAPVAVTAAKPIVAGAGSPSTAS